MQKLSFRSYWYPGVFQKDSTKMTPSEKKEKKKMAPAVFSIKMAPARKEKKKKKWQLPALVRQKESRKTAPTTSVPG